MGNDLFLRKKALSQWVRQVRKVRGRASELRGQALDAIYTRRVQTFVSSKDVASVFKHGSGPRQLDMDDKNYVTFRSREKVFV